MDGFMSIRKTADEFGLPENMLRTWVKTGECPGFYVGTKFMVNIDMLDAKLKDMSRRNVK